MATEQTGTASQTVPTEFHEIDILPALLVFLSMLVLVFLSFRQKRVVAPRSGTRNPGMDLLRIYATFKVIVVHSFSNGGVLASTTIPSIHFFLSWLMCLFGFPAICIFGIISGYASYSPEPRPFVLTTYFKVWIPAVFYNVVINTVSLIVNPKLATWKDILCSFLPVSTGLHWYLTAYSGLFILIPLLDAGIRTVDKEYLSILIILCSIVFSFIETISGVFLTQKGVSFIWLVILYIIGGAMKRINLFSTVSTRNLVLLLFLVFGINYLLFILLPEAHFRNLTLEPERMVYHTTLGFLLQGMLYVTIFSRLRLPPRVVRLVHIINPTTFSVYILNTQRVSMYLLQQGRFTFVPSYPWPYIPVIIYSFTLLFVITASAIDILRMKLFAGIKQFILWAVSCLSRSRNRRQRASSRPNQVQNSAEDDKTALMIEISSS